MKMRSLRKSLLLRRPVASTIRAGIVASAIVIGGCADIIITQSSNDLNFRPGVLSTFSYAVVGGEMRTVVIGNPFQIPKEALDRAVTAAMQGHNNGPPAIFTTTPSANVRESFYVVVAFDVPDSVANNQLCVNPETVPTKPEGSGLGLLMVFCAGKDLQSWATAFGPRITSPSDPSFADMVTSATRLLIPDHDDEPNHDFVVMSDPGDRT